MITPLDKLPDTLDGGTTALTATGRLARDLRVAHDARELAAGRISWETPDILSLWAWTRRSWAEYGAETPLPLLLAPFQEQALWERIIGESEKPGETELLQVSRIALEAKAAWRQMKRWRVPEEAYGAAGHEEARMFRAWAKAFARLCETHHWIDPASALDTLIRAARAGKLRLGPRIILAGFEEFDPQQQALLDALNAAGVEWISWMPPLPSPDAPSAARVSLPDEEQELESAARWARALLERGDPGPIGIMLPDLAGRRPAVSRVFERVLCPEAGAGHRDAPRPFEFSLGGPLLESPPVRDAVLALGMARGQRPAQEFSQLLLSPYFAGGETESTARAGSDVSLRALGEPWLTLETAGRHLEVRLKERNSESPEDQRQRDRSTGYPGTLRFRTGLWRMAMALRKLPPSRTFSQWARTFVDWLEGLGWPGERAPNEEERQAVAALYGLLAEFADLGSVSGEQDLPGAWSRLRRMARMRLFQPTRPSAASNPAPIRIREVSEMGLGFRHLWILGLHADAWPPAPRPLPFLPATLRRRLGIPLGRPESELSRARRATQRMLAGANHVIASHARSDRDLSRAPSPLITALPEIDQGDIPRSRFPNTVGAFSRADSNHNDDDKEWLIDERGPALSRDEPMTGGARIWRDQAACPFRAFATHRLGAAGLDTPSVGLDYAMRGIMAHRALESIWRELRDSDRLALMTDDRLRAKVSESVERALLDAARRRPETFRGHRLRQLEAERLSSLIMAWLEGEKERPPFAVAAPERGRAVSLGGVPVSLRPDRLDHTKEGKHLLLDYKTGDVGIQSWFGERPREPQLPLYAILQECDGIGFAFVRRGKIGFEGIADTEGLAPGIETVRGTGTRAAGEFQDWDALREAWRGVLVSLARAFARGDAFVDPKSPMESCRNCDLPSLCRIHGKGNHRP
uniref:Probable DNA repair protein n=1 Tax=Candidatus Kentrum sp. SD TaxID=2126332 RepID=A0A450YEY5_9GAMM|nr:MAG: probable DNA repair protein [Candidatus Kentron sp. SD]VFK45225.1 MAG: probable DNA repair protein [Candidatus Kentron sp. SD]